MSPPSSPDCTNRHRSGYTCLDLGRNEEDCCAHCREVVSQRLAEEEDIIVPSVDLPGKEVAFFDLPAKSFPFDIVFINKDTKETWHEIHVTGPGTVEIPSIKQPGIKNSEVIVRYPDGTVIRSS